MNADFTDSRRLKNYLVNYRILISTHTFLIRENPTNLRSSAFYYFNRQHAVSAAICLLIVLTAFLAKANEQLDLRLPPGFEATLFADDDLASDLYAYLRTLQ